MTSRHDLKIQIHFKGIEELVERREELHHSEGFHYFSVGRLATNSQGTGDFLTSPCKVFRTTRDSL
jgi:hypothetical protein